LKRGEQGGSRREKGSKVIKPEKGGSHHNWARRQEARAVGGEGPCPSYEGI